MSEKVIKVEALSKQYRLGTVGTGSLVHDINRSWHQMRGKEDPYLKVGESNDRTTKSNSDYIWALKDINFEVKQGEVLGIIGRNGAGKSTLLKILSRTTSPTTGSIKLKGRVASLLEVGTGFHPELSGRDNIYLNGAILGMHKHEIKQKFDEIVDFAGVERYIDTPVKRYSSGMYVRLAFGVAAHLEPEILIVDEVLAVGDTEFQKKALGKMKSVSEGEGRTVLFVSHNMASIQSLCSKCIYMKDGKIVIGPSPTSDVVSKYLNTLTTEVLRLPLHERSDREGEGEILVIDILLKDRNGNITDNFTSGQQVAFEVQYVNTQRTYDSARMEISVTISRQGDNLVSVMSNKYVNFEILNLGERHSISFIIDRLPLMAGNYIINVMIRKSGNIQDWIKEAVLFTVENGDYYNTGFTIPESHKGIYLDYRVDQI